MQLNMHHHHGPWSMGHGQCWCMTVRGGIKVQASRAVEHLWSRGIGILGALLKLQGSC